MNSTTRRIALALVTAALLLCGLVWYSMARRGEWEVILVIAVVVLVGVGLFWVIDACVKCVRNPPRSPDDPFRGLFAAVVAPIASVTTILLVLSGLGAVSAILVVFLPTIISVPVIFCLFKLVPGWTRRKRTERAVIGQIATVVRQNLPLSAGLTVAAKSESGRARLYLLHIAGLLGQGASLSEAIRLGYPNCSAFVLTLIIAGEKAGQLTAAVDQAEAYLVEQITRSRRSDVSPWGYALTISILTAFVLTGMMVAVVPKFKEIFKDFGTSLPPATVALFEASESLWDFWPVLVLMVLLVPTWIHLRVRPRRVPRLAWTSRLADWIRWNIPGLHRLEFSDGMSAILRMMNIAVRSGMDLAPAARLAAQLDVNARLKPRMAHFADALQTGGDLRKAARSAGLGEITATALAAGQRTGNVEAGLDYAASYHQAVVSRLWVVLTNMAWPMVTLILGTLVAFVVLAMFEPLVFLINAVMGGA